MIFFAVVSHFFSPFFTDLDSIGTSSLQNDGEQDSFIGFHTSVKFCRMYEYTSIKRQ